MRSNKNKRSKMRMVIAKVIPVKMAVAITAIVMKLVINKMIVTVMTVVEMKPNIVIKTRFFHLSS